MTAEEKSALEMESDIEKTREEMEDTIDAIKRKLAPEEIVEKAAEYVRQNSGDLMMNVGQTLKDNPVPFAIMGLGLGWLVYSARSRSSEGGAVNYEEAYEGYDYGHTTADSYKEEAKRTASTAKRRASEAYEGISESVAEVIDDISAKTTSAMESISNRASEAIDTTKSTVQRHPLMVGAAGLAIGVAVAMLLPRTQREDGSLGETRDRVVRKVKEAGRETLDKAKDVASDAWQAAKETAIDEALPKKGEAKQASKDGRSTGSGI